MSSRACTWMLEVVFVSTVSTARNLELELVCIKNLFSALLFILVLEALLCQFSIGVLWEVL